MLRAVDVLDGVLKGTAAAVLFAMMLLTFVDVMMRNLAASPVHGAFEITELMLVVLIFAGLPLTSRAGEHVTLDTLDPVIGRRGALILDRFANLLSGSVLLGVSWLMIRRAARMAGTGDTSAQLQIPYWPFVYFMAALVAVTALIHLVYVFVPHPLGHGPVERTSEGDIVGGGL